MVANFTFAWSWVMAWNSSCRARFCNDRRYGTRSHGILMFKPSRMMRWYLPNTVTTHTVACGTLRKIEKMTLQRHDQQHYENRVAQETEHGMPRRLTDSASIL